VAVFASVIQLRDGDQYESRLEWNINRPMDILNEDWTRATFLS
jgi:hypothetical protein